MNFNSRKQSKSKEIKQEPNSEDMPQFESVSLANMVENNPKKVSKTQAVSEAFDILEGNTIELNTKNKVSQNQHEDVLKTEDNLIDDLNYVDVKNKNKKQNELVDNVDDLNYIDFSQEKKNQK